MARVNNLSNFLTDVASAIKTKKGSETAIPAANFDTEILALPSQGVYQTKVITINENGQTVITPDSGYDAMDGVQVTTNVPEKQLQTKTYNFTQNTNIQLLPDSGYDGFDTVTLNINVPGSTINNQDKTITQNGAYTADSGYTGLGTVTVNVPSGSGDVKLFETEQAMQADPNPSEGDLAVVYREELTGVTEDSEFSSCAFPNEVVLDEAFSDNVFGSFRAVDPSVMFDGMVEMSSSGFRFSGYGESSEISVRYTSQDGITYTRTDGGEELQEFGTVIKYEPMEPWNDVLGNFMKIGGNHFEGLYQSQSIKIKNTYILDNNRIKIAQYDNFNDSQYALMIKHKFSENEISEYTLLTMNKNIYPFIDSNNKLWVYNSSLTTSLEEYSVNAESYSSRRIIAGTRFSSGAIVNNITDIGITVDLDSCIPLGNPLYSGDSTDVVKTIDELTKIKDISTIEPEQVYELKYLPVSTQLDATADYVYEKTFYGKSGVENGTLTTGVSNSFTDVNAEVYAKIQAQYNNMQPRILTDQDKDIDSDIRIIPSRSDGTPLLDTSNVTDMFDMFCGCYNLISIPLLDTKKVNTMSSMFNSCYNLILIPLLDTSNVTNMGDMFNSCYNLISIPLLDTSNVTKMNGMFSSCKNLTTVPNFNTSNVTNMFFMFNGCTSLTSVPQFDTSNVTDMGNMFDSCNSLSNESLNNILAMCTNSALTANKNLKYIRLTEEQANICKTLSNYQAFVNAGWTTGY